jgi:uncharacterized membrane protein
MSDDHAFSGAPTPDGGLSRPPVLSGKDSDREEVVDEAEWQKPQRRGALTPVLNVGILLFPLAMLAFGIEHIIFAGAVDDAMYPWVLRVPAWNYIFGTLLIALSVSIGIKKRAPSAAGVLGATLSLYSLLLYVPRIVAYLHEPGPWTSNFGIGSPLAAAGELLAMSGVAWVLAGDRMERRPRFPTRAINGETRLGRILFAGSLTIFGVQHLIYHDSLATLVPSWIPWHLFWAEFIGAAFIVSAAGIATKTAERSAALLLGTMFGLIVLLLHVPRVIAAARSLDEWNSAFVAVAMSGGAFVLAEASKRSIKR